jgi:hypothetical protein
MRRNPNFLFFSRIYVAVLVLNLQIVSKIDHVLYTFGTGFCVKIYVYTQSSAKLDTQYIYVIFFIIDAYNQELWTNLS